jgi:hypothetical protein
MIAMFKVGVREKGALQRPARRPPPAPPPAGSPMLLSAGDALGAATADDTAALPADLLQDDEVVILLLRPSPLFIVLGALGSLAVIAMLTLFLAYLSAFPWIPWTDEVAFALGAAGTAARLVWQALEWWSRVYVLTDRRLIRRMGVVRVAVFEAPLSRIQHTSVFQRLRERLFGLGTLGFATAGSDVYEAFWVMIARPFAVHRAVVEAMNRYGRNRSC